jgi:hypothetical protein
VPFSCNDHRTGAVADHCQWSRVQRFHALNVAHCHCINCSRRILGNRPLQILRLKSFAGPATGRRAMESECSAHTIVRVGTSQQRIYFLGSSLGTA